MRYYIIAGEASGDLHGSNLVRELKKKDPEAVIRCWGGDLMQEAGAQLVKHYRDLAFMGFVEVISNIRTIFRNLEFCKSDIRTFGPDTLILIDYPGFNLRIAQWAKKEHIRVIYYISPQVWAWKENRVRRMKETIGKMMVILPFEKSYYKNRWNWDVDYVGHPLVEVVDRFRRSATKPDLSSTKEPTSPENEIRGIVALLPGSRKQEIIEKLPVMLEVSGYFPGYRFVVARAPGVDPVFYESMLAPFPNVSSVSNQTYALLNTASAALVTSGTATLETALFGVPQVVCYRGNPVSYAIAKRVIRVKYISLVNLILDKPAIRELIQKDLTVTNLRSGLDEILNNPETKSRIKEDYGQLEAMLRTEDTASSRAASLVIDYLKG